MVPPPLYAHDPFLSLHWAMQSRWLDLPAAALSTLCEGWALLLLGLLVFCWMERNPGRVLAVLLPLPLALLASGGLTQDLKELCATPRPLMVFGPHQVRVGMEPLYLHGFPSGHSSAVATFAVYANLVYGRRARWTFGLMVLGGLSRVYVGAHWVTDVIGGWGLGTLLGMLGYGLAIWLFPGGYLARLRRERRQTCRPPEVPGAARNR
ncbi:MAG TPA: phosphatase PAP2 family protein [Anaeromyxobacteraceae bacterium]|nr:phosphatase PAP2 family protein [Anaeromyxobacteraceae bacterium]